MLKVKTHDPPRIEEGKQIWMLKKTERNSYFKNKKYGDLFVSISIA